MQLGLSFSALLAGILAISSVEAAPLARRGKSVSLPLERTHGLRAGVPVDVQLAQHINRSHRRHARMTGRAEPTQEELESHFERRTAAPAPAKRFQRPDVLTSAEAITHTWTLLNDTPAPRSFASESHRRHIEALAGQLHGQIDAAGKTKLGSVGTGKKGKGKGGKKGGKGAAAAAAGAGATAGAGAAAAGADTAASGAAAKANVAAAASGAADDKDTAQGFSPDALAAQSAGGLTDSNTPSTKNALALNIEADDVGYIATFQLGTPPTNYNILCDSGSADLWVGSADGCVNTDTGASNCGKHTFLGSKTSSTFVDTKESFNVTYGTGSVLGDKITDNLVVAGLNLKAHAFGVATQESDDFADDATPFDGLMGLAKSTLSNQGVATPPEALATAGLISDAIVSFKIPRLLDDAKNGQITFGASDPATFDAKTLVTLDNVNPDGFWEAAMDAVSFNGKDLGLAGRTSILDTGTTLIVAPPADVETVISAVPGSKSDGQGNFAIPCTTSQQLSLTFGGQEFLIDPRDFIFAPVDPNDLTGDCIPGISAGQIGGATEWLVGDVFLKNAVFTTNVGKNNIQLASPVAA